ncbi:FAM174 family membrane protein [Microbacterium sp. BK668]|nr:FAM174 family membrane protein [Microbacterium sp. BK668]TDN91210.1 hypothetical protein EV279_0709 [Microbacterium sp. BK668]
MATEQALLYGVTIVVLAATLVVFVVQLVRMNRRDKDGRGDD